MQLINMNIIENSIKTAEYKLSLHRKQGSKSGLTIIQVAQLMDRIRMGENNNSQESTVGFSLN